MEKIKKRAISSFFLSKRCNIGIENKVWEVCNLLFVITENKPNNKIIEKLAPFIDTFEVVFAESLKELI